MILLGLTGPIGHGKTTFAKALAKLEPSSVRVESSLLIAEVANEMHSVIRTPFDPYDVDKLNDWIKFLPSILQKIVHVKCTYEQLKLDPVEIEKHPVEYQKLLLHAENLRRNFTLAGQDINSTNKEVYRPFLQWLGGYLVEKVDSGIWWNEIVRRIQDAKENGAQLCIADGLRFPTDATILRDAGGIILKVYRPGHLQNDMLDPTERERSSIHIDCSIMCDGTIGQVDTCAEAFYSEVKINQMKLIYKTSDY